MKNKIALFFLAGLILPLTTLAVTLDNPIGFNNFGDLAAAIINIVAGIIGSLAVMMFLWAGILFLTSTGDPTKIQKARQATIYAVVGVAVALAATGIIALVKQIIGA